MSRFLDYIRWDHSSAYEIQVSISLFEVKFSNNKTGSGFEPDPLLARQVLRAEMCTYELLYPIFSIDTCEINFELGKGPCQNF